MNKILFPPTKMKIRRLYTKDGFTKEEIAIMYRDYPYEKIMKALYGLKKAPRL